MKEKVERNRLIYELREMGVNGAQIGRKYNISRQRVSFIYKKEENRRNK